MRDVSKYESFVRDINFDAIRNIDRVFDKGFMSENFFDSDSLHSSVKEVSPWHFPQQVLVYFKRIDAGFVSPKEQKRREWWLAINEFRDLVKDFPAGFKMEYWYGSDGNHYSLPEFEIKKDPYQAFINLFDGALSGFSCFVNEEQNRLGFNSEISNYSDMQPGEGLFHEHYSVWKGEAKTFLQSASDLEGAFKAMHRAGYYSEKSVGKPLYVPEVRVFFPQRGVLISNLYNGKNSTGIFVKEKTMDNMLYELNQNRERFLTIV